MQNVKSWFQKNCSTFAPSILGRKRGAAAVAFGHRPLCNVENKRTFAFGPTEMVLSGKIALLRYSFMFPDLSPQLANADWKRTQPDLFAHLKSAVDSDVSSLVNLEEHRFTDYLTSGVAGEPGIVAGIVAGIVYDENPEYVLSLRLEAMYSKAELTKLLEYLEHTCAADSDEMQVIAALGLLADLEETIKTKV